MNKIDHFEERLDQLAREKNISKEALIEALKAALASATKKNLPPTTLVDVRLEKNGSFKVFQKWVVVETVTDPAFELTLEEAKKINPKVELGGEVEKDITPHDFGRLAAQTAKQVIIQRIREAEKDEAFSEFTAKSGEIITGTVQKREPFGYLVNLGRLETFLSKQECIPGENYHTGDMLKLYVTEVKKTSKGPLVVVSRTHPNLVAKLFEREIPEIQDGIIEIKAVAREAGKRTKIAVYSNDKNVAAIGTCVGQMGNRIQNISRELDKERVDIVEWSERPETFIVNSLSPAKISNVELQEETKTSRILVAEDQLPLAIGKEGQNVRLASRLTGWKIDIVTGKTAESANISKLKVHELAKELDVSSKDILDAAKTAGVQAKSATSSIEGEDLEKIRSLVKEGKNA
jgi:N utilization substance protein A